MPGIWKSQQLMKTIRRQDDGGAPDLMSPFMRINTEFGAWKQTTFTTPTSTTTPRMMNSSDVTLDNKQSPRAAAPVPPAPTPSPASANTRLSCRTFSPRGSYRHGTPRYSKLDAFIEGLDAACEALPTPLVGSASAAPPPPSRATAKELSSSITQQQDRHPHQHPRKPHQTQEDHRPRLTTGGIVKEVKFAEEVIEIGESERTSDHIFAFSERNVFEVSGREPPGMEEMATDSAGAPPPPRISRAVRFDYRKKRSDFVKAATVVQSTYRGYKVRRGQPLKHLLVISSVKEKLEELRQQFDAWKIAAWFPTDLTERATMTESVMDLLVQLDSLHGVPVVVREFRKIVARDVIKFQEEVDGFLTRNSKHGVLFDLTRPGGKAVEGSNNLKSSKTIRNILVQEPNLIENLRESDSKACSSYPNGIWREGVKSGTIMSMDVTSGLESNCQSQVNEVPLYSVEPHSSSVKNFVLWSPGDTEFEKVREEKSSEEKQLESVTELRKCVASTANLDMYVPPDRKKKSLRVRFGAVSFGNRSFRKEYLPTDDECPNAPPEDTDPWNSTYVESSMKDMHHSPDVFSWKPTGVCQKKDDPQWTISINKQRSLDAYADDRTQIPKDGRIPDGHENLSEDCDIRYSQTHARPQTPGQSDCSRSEKWEAAFPADLDLDNPIDGYTGIENGEDHEIRHPQTLAQPNYSWRNKWEADFPTDLRCDNPIEPNKSCAGMENTPDLSFEPTLAKAEDLHIPVQEVTSKDLYDEHFRTNQTKLQAFPSRVEYVSAKDVREGITEPLLAGDGEDSEKDYPVAVSQLECSSKDTFQSFGGYDYIGLSARGSEGDRMGMSQDMQNGLDIRDDDLSGAAVFTEEGEKLQNLRSPGNEEVEAGQSTLPKNCRTSPMLTPLSSVVNGNIREQLDGKPGNEYDLCRFDDLETISSCSNCAACAGDCAGEPWDFESGIHEQVQNQPYALKGLVRKLDEAFVARKGEDQKHFEAGHWKDEAWRDYTITEFQPYHIATITSQPNFEREVEVEREDDSCKSFKTFESDKLQNFTGTEPKFPVGTELVSTHKDHPDIGGSTCPESNGSNLACTSQSLGGEGAAFSSMALVLHENERNMLSKLVEDNRRLKELLKEVMKWNTVQANAMITLNERLEQVESKK